MPMALTAIFSCRQVIEPEKEPEEEKDQPVLILSSPASMEIGAQGGNGTIVFSANRDWKLRCSDTWVSVSPVSGHASNRPISVAVNYEKNPGYDDRHATITIEMGESILEVNVSQSARDGLIVPTRAYDLTADARTIQVEVQSNVSYSVSISADWMEQAETKGLVSNILVFNVKQNTTTDAREGTIIVRPDKNGVQEQVISVSQAQQDALIVNDTGYVMPFGGGEIEVAVDANVEFDVSSSADWIHHTLTKALRSSVVCLHVDENPAYDSREGTVAIVQKDGSLAYTITVTQAGRIPATSVELNLASLNLVVGDKEKLVATVKPDNATDPSVTWESDHPEIASVDDQGMVVALAQGTATITAKAAPDQSAACVVTVQYGVPRNQVWYTTLSGQPARVNGTGTYILVSNTYENGKGVIVFNENLEYIPMYLINGTDVTSVEIPEGVKSIKYGAFDLCRDLASVKLPESLEVIGPNAFSACSSLKEIDFPAHLRVLEGGAFGESGLRSIALPDGLEILGGGAFIYCESLTEDVVIPQSVQQIGERVFEGCPNLKRVDVECIDPPACSSAAFRDGYVWGGKEGCEVFVPDESGAAYAAAQGWKDILPHLYTKSGTPLTSMAYTSTDYSHDNELIVLQEATVGRGIPLLYLGDGFVDRDMEPGGLFEQEMRRGMEALFCWEPFKTFRNRFSVYAIKTVSRNNSYAWSESDRVFSEDGPSWYGYSEYDIMLKEVEISSFLQQIPNLFDIPVSVFYLFNNDLSEGRSNNSTNRGVSESYIFDLQAIAHEMGHGFAGLVDEYITYDGEFTNEDKKYIDQKHGEGKWANVDYHDNPSEVIWSRFITDPRYAGEQIGVYKGASFSREYLYRPTMESCMRDDQLAFNAPCREAIYKRIMQYSEGESWTYDYEIFVEADAPGREQACSRIPPLSSE